MKQRLGIAISLLGNPELLILDEPINGLDPEGVFEIRKMLETLNRTYGTTIIIASHIISELYKLATNYAIIDEGRLIDEFNKDDLEKACTSNIHLTIKEGYLQDILQLITSHYPHLEYEIISNKTILLHDKIDPSSLNQYLVKNKIPVCGLGINEENIEKFFIDKISGGRKL